MRGRRDVYDGRIGQPLMGWPGRAQRLLCWTAVGEALRKAQGACDAHISTLTGHRQHDWDRRRQEHVPFGRVRQARRDYSEAKGHPASAWTPAQQYAALSDRDGNLFRHAFYRTTAYSAWSRCASDP